MFCTPNKVNKSTAIRTPNTRTPSSRTPVPRTPGSSSVEESHVEVNIRIRPLNKRELSCNEDDIVKRIENEISIFPSDGVAGLMHTFKYDHIYDSRDRYDLDYASQETVFKGVAVPLIDRSFEGYNACLLAYGQTGSGKTYSITGTKLGLNNDGAGIIPRFGEEIFKRINSLKDTHRVEVEIGYFEIYNEKIYDLLTSSRNQTTTSLTNEKTALRVREHPVLGPHVVDLQVVTVANLNDFLTWVALGNTQRARSATEMNEKSSRSHCILNVCLTISEFKSRNLDTGRVKKSKISIVDLAGSERVTKSGIVGDRLAEGVKINKSLLTLGKVINALAERRKTPNNFIPYRDSLLTWLLRENLGGNSRTVMLATITPAASYVEETLATLRYACQAGAIVNRVKVNAESQTKLINELEAEINRLLAIQRQYETSIQFKTQEDDLPSVIKKLEDTEKELARLRQSFDTRVSLSIECSNKEKMWYKSCGATVMLPSMHDLNEPSLLTLSPDPALSGMVVYILKNGKTIIGCLDVECKPYVRPDIILSGCKIGKNHCGIDYMDGELKVFPISTRYQTHVNGELIKKTTRLRNGDRLVIGETHFLQVSNPKDSTEFVEMDYHDARKELIEAEKKKLHENMKRLERDLMEKGRQQDEEHKAKLLLLEAEKENMMRTSELVVNQNESLISIEEIRPRPAFDSLVDQVKNIISKPTTETLQQNLIMVTKANNICERLRTSFEFKLIQRRDSFDLLQSIIVIIDNTRHKQSEWPTARLSIWLENSEYLTKDNLFNAFDMEWTDLNDQNDEIINCSIESRKSINGLNDNIKSLDNVEDKALHYLKEMETYRMKLKELFEQRSNIRSNYSSRVSNSVLQSTKQLHDIMYGIRQTLESNSRNTPDSKRSKTVRFQDD